MFWLQNRGSRAQPVSLHRFEEIAQAAPIVEDLRS